MLGIVVLLGGHSWLSQQLVACVIGTGTVVVIGVAGRRLAGARVGLIGAGIGAVYAGLWIYERDLLSETLLLLGIAVTLALAYRFLDSPTPWLAAGLGIMTGLLALTRSEEILGWIFLVVPLILSVRTVDFRRRMRWLAIATASMVIVVAPWTIYNLRRFQHVVILSTNSGSAVAQGNCDQVYYGPYIGSYVFGCVGFVNTNTTDETVASPILFRKGRYVRRASSLPSARLFLAREGRSFGFWNPFQQISIDSRWQVTPLWVNRMGLFTYWLLLVPAVAGVVVLRRRRRGLYPLLVFGGNRCRCDRDPPTARLGYGPRPRFPSFSPLPARGSTLAFAACIVKADRMLRQSTESGRSECTTGRCHDINCHGSRPVRAGSPRANRVFCPALLSPWSPSSRLFPCSQPG